MGRLPDRRLSGSAMALAPATMPRAKVMRATQWRLRRCRDGVMNDTECVEGIAPKSYVRQPSPVNCRYELDRVYRSSLVPLRAWCCPRCDRSGRMGSTVVEL